MNEARESGGEEPLDQERRERLEAALEGAASWYEIYDRLHKAVPEGQEERYRALIWAFGYDLVGPEELERREREGSSFGAMFEFPDGRMPPKLADVPAAEMTVWDQAYAAIDDPRARSRLGDLLWEARVEPRPDLKARTAATALVELSEDADWEPMEATEGLVRALELARQVSDQQLVERVVSRMSAVIRSETATEEDRPGIPFSLLRALVDLPEATRPSDLDELIGLCEKSYGSDPFQLDTAIDLRAELAGPGKGEELRQQQVRLWRKRAGEVEGLVRLSFLRSALDLARTHGLAEDAEQLRVELAQVDEAELDLKAISAEVKVSSEQIEAYVGAFIDPEDWRRSLRRFALHGPPGGEPEAIAETVAKQMREHPIQYLVTKMVLDPDTGIPIFEANDDETHTRAARAERRMFAMRLWGVFAVQILGRIDNECGRPSRDELVTFFSTHLIDEVNADRIARAFELWWDGEADQSAHLLAPRLEAVIREMARQLGLPIVREPIANKPGKVRGLGELLRALAGRIGTPGWHDYLTSLLADSLGLNLRNVVGHGLRAEIAVDDAALLLHAACYLAMLERSEQPQQDGE